MPLDNADRTAHVLFKSSVLYGEEWGIPSAKCTQLQWHIELSKEWTFSPGSRIRPISHTCALWGGRESDSATFLAICACTLGRVSRPASIDDYVMM